MAIIKTDDAHYKNIANKIREKLDTNTAYKPSEMSDKIQDIYDTAYVTGFSEGEAAGRYMGHEEGIEEGKNQAYGEIEDLNTELEQTLYGTDTGGKSYYDTFWDTFFYNRDTFSCAFSLWRGEMFKPNNDIIFQNSVNSADQTFQYAKYFDLKERTVDKGLSFDTSQAKRLASTFHTSCIGNIPVIDLSSCTQLIRTFYFMQEDTLWGGTYTTKEINIVNLRSDCTFDNAFGYIYGLERLIINGTIGQNGFTVQWSKKLSKASHESIMNALSTTTSGLTVTFSKVAVDQAFETSAGANDGSTSAEWLTLIATRSNWTVALA